ncbi:MAG TPA: hypothetical protein VFA59_19840 [Vicinamibacterales bacterium]|nr:hypothetical protein [Vicinamibacterales bacterium]
MRRSFVVAVLISALAGGVLVRAGQQGVGQVPSPLPLTQTVRDRGSSVTPAFEGWYYDKDGSQRFLVGYFNRNMKQEFDIPVGPNNHIDPGGPDQGQPTHFQSGRQWGIVSIKVPKDLGDKKLTWTIVANGFTNSITLHTKADYIVEPFEDAASKNTPPKIKFAENGPIFTGPPTVNAETLTATTGAPLTLTTWVTDEGPKINVPENPGRGRGARGARGASGATGASGASGAAGARGASGARGRGDAAAAGLPEGFTPPPPIAVTWAVYRQPAGAVVKFDPAKPKVDVANGGKNETKATFDQPGDYIIRIQANDSTGDGGGGFECCWSNAYVKVTVTGSATSK